MNKTNREWDTNSYNQNLIKQYYLLNQTISNSTATITKATESNNKSITTKTDYEINSENNYGNLNQNFTTTSPSAKQREFPLLACLCDRLEPSFTVPIYQISTNLRQSIQLITNRLMMLMNKINENNSHRAYMKLKLNVKALNKLN